MKSTTINNKSEVKKDIPYSQVLSKEQRKSQIKLELAFIELYCRKLKLRAEG